MVCLRNFKNVLNKLRKLAGIKYYNIEIKVTQRFDIFFR